MSEFKFVLENWWMKIFSLLQDWKEEEKSVAKNIVVQQASISESKVPEKWFFRMLVFHIGLNMISEIITAQNKSKTK
jgi:hypothetical protein